jgi:glycosyltransferase involved in cell wall biosynthesis
MRLLLANYEYPPVGGGAATATQALAHKFVELGHRVTVVTGKFGDLPDESEVGGVAIARIPCLRRKADRSNVFEMFTFTVSSLLFFRALIREHRPDGIIAFFSIPSGPFASAAQFFFNVPYVVSLRGSDVPGLTPEISTFHKLLAPIRRYILRHAQEVVANSTGLKKLSETIDRVPVRVIPNGVDPEFFRPGASKTEKESPARRFQILFVGRFHAQKNISCLLEQCAQLPAGAFDLHLVGDGALRGKLRSQADQLGLSGAVEWHGWLSRSALRERYHRADCCVNPSAYEGLPNTVLEAMASGLPVVASRVPGNEDLVSHGKTGLLFDLQDPSELASHLRALANDRALGQTMGRAARIAAERDYSWRNVAERYAALFD